MRSARRPLLFAVAIATAGLQVAIASRWPGRAEHLTALVVGWAAALWSTWLDRDRLPDAAGQPFTQLLGAALLAGAWVATIAGHGGYVTLSRFLPAAAGVGLVLISAGARRLWAQRNHVVLLSLTLLYPLPYAIQQTLMPTRLTAAVASVLVRALGVPVQRAGTVLVFPDTTLRVFDACSGIALMTQVTLLAAVVLCFFPTSLRRGVVVLAIAMAAGFLVNAARVALLGVVASRAPSEFDYWEQYVAGSVLFPVIATALAGALWGCVLRSSRDEVASMSLDPATKHPRCE